MIDDPTHETVHLLNFLMNQTQWVHHKNLKCLSWLVPKASWFGEIINGLKKMSLFNELLASETETYCICLCYGMDYGPDEWNRTEFKLSPISDTCRKNGGL